MLIKRSGKYIEMIASNTDLYMTASLKRREIRLTTSSQGFYLSQDDTSCLARVLETLQVEGGDTDEYLSYSDYMMFFDTITQR